MDGYYDSIIDWIEKRYKWKIQKEWLCISPGVVTAINIIVKLMIICNPHNPIGRVWTKEELEEIGKICLKYDVVVISDEIHSDLIYKGYKHTSFASISEEFEQNSITCTAPSKTFNLAGLQTSNIILH